METFAARHKDEMIVANSRSGGVFTALSDAVLDNGGVVYGVILNENLEAVHTRATTKQERDKMRGSKYIPSSLGDTFANVKKDLESGIQVLFVGTSCQVVGLRKYIGDNADNLVCVDIVCHGVPQISVWKDYISWMEDKYKSKICGVEFRNKKRYGWRRHKSTLYFSSGKVVNSWVYSNLYDKNYIIREACYKCPYRNLQRNGDISIADYWGIEKAAPEFDDDKGVNLVLVNTPEGESLWSKSNNDLYYKSTRIEDSMQPPLRGSLKKPEDMDQFRIDYSTRDFNYIAKKYTGFTVINRIKQLIGELIKK